MRRAKRTLAILALTTSTLVSCTGTITPASPPATTVEALRLYTTTATRPLTNSLAAAFNESGFTSSIDSRNGNYLTILGQVERGEAPYFITNHLPANSPLWTAPIGQDAITIIAHPDMQLDNLTLDQLREIYQGRITSWETLGGDAQNITVFSREEGSATRYEFERLLMGNSTTIASARIAASTQSMIDSIIRTPGAIGYVSMGFLNATDQSNLVHVFALAGTIPTIETTIANLYPLRSSIFVVGMSEPQGIYRQFIAWMQSPAGQAIMSTYYAPLSP
ncbi:MAG: substrate-binding domain-containing protein [Aggregatilineales bacterium]